MKDPEKKVVRNGTPLAKTQVSKDPQLDRLKKQYPSMTITATYPKGPSWERNKKPKYKATDKSGNSVTVYPGGATGKKRYSVSEILKMKK